MRQNRKEFAGVAADEESPPFVFLPEPAQQSSPSSKTETKRTDWKATICPILCCLVLGGIGYGIYYAATKDSSSDDQPPIEGDGSWIDTSTPENARSVVGMEKKVKLDLVFSDEFMDNDRQFADGMDTRWTAEDRPGVTNGALQYYNSSHVKTSDGMLVIETTNQDASVGIWHFLF